jgi:cytochrome c-type biogenesis protein CcmF
LGLIFAVAIGFASLAPLWKRNLRRTPLFTWGMVVAHFGCAVSVAGMACDSAFTQENMVAMAPGETRNVGPYAVTFQGVRERAGANFTALEAVTSVRNEGGNAFEMLPQLHQFSDPPMQTNQAAIRTFWNGQLYLVVGEQADSDRWLMRMWWKPFVTLIWLGGALIALGGVLALLGRLKRDIWRGRQSAKKALT